MEPLLGLQANWRQFTLLVLVNAFVGAMVGVERSVLPLVAEQEFGLASRTALLSFIATFGLVKAGTNLLAGRWSDRSGRKPVLLAGWATGLPVPLVVAFAPTWDWVVAANALLGVNQGLAWSATVIMKTDLAGPARRGLAMGLNEAAGYGAVSLAALGAGYAAAALGLRPYPFLLAEGLAVAGLLLSACAVQETRRHAAHEARTAAGAAGGPARFWPAFVAVSLRNRTLSGASQAGLVNNLNDGLAWGLLPVYFTAAGLDVAQVASLAAVYPAVWGLGQLATGAVSDAVGRKPPVVAGMALQAAAIGGLAATDGFPPWFGCMVLLGVGTALVYPTLLAAVSDAAGPAWRATALGVYRLWRDAGYAAGALVAGLAADALGAPWALVAVAALTGASGLVALLRMRETVVRPRGCRDAPPCSG